MNENYIHGYSEEEQQRLISQNEVLAPYIYSKWDFSQIKHLVEIGCGVGAQMMVLLDKYPNLYITGVEQSLRQLRRAEANLAHFPAFHGRYTFLQGDAINLNPGFANPPEAVLVVWVLEHVPEPMRLLQHIRKWIPQGCTLYITEVFHDSFQTWPYVEAIDQYWKDTLQCQRRLGGDPNIGIQLAELLVEAGFNEVNTLPHTFFLDQSRPQERAVLLEYWLNLMRSALHECLSTGDTTLDRWQRAESSMYELMKKPEAVFYYSFIQAEASW